ncbi:amidohydrolase family protein, partial [Amycolatopsis cihanbeyliensis]
MTGKPARTVLTGGCVLEVESGEIVRAEVLVEDERIRTIGEVLDAAGAARVDCTGGLLVPGLIDCHAHIAFPQPGDAPRSARLFEAAAVLRTLLGRGVTTVRDAWGADSGFRLALEQGWITGPDLLLSLRQLCTTGGIGDPWNPRTGSVDALGDPALPEPVFDGPDAARAAVRRMVRAGADWIKLGASGAMSEGDRVHDALVTAAEVHAVVDEAERQGGRPVMVHAHGARPAELAARAGVRSIEHGVWLDAAAVAAMAEHGCWYVPTLTPIGRQPEAAEAHRASVRRALEAGVPIAAGSD